MTYADVLQHDPSYCKWVVDWGISQCTQRGGWQWPFIAYVQHRWLMDCSQPPEGVRVSAKKDCLDGASFAITGKPAEMPRHVLEEVILFFGGKVVQTVSQNT